MRKACKKVIEESENMSDIGFVKFKGVVESKPVVLVKVEIEAIKIRNAAIYELDHSVLKLKQSRVIK
jgi:hypothetical protein